MTIGARLIGPRYVGAGRSVGDPPFEASASFVSRASISTDTPLLTTPAVATMEVRATATKVLGERRRGFSAGLEARASLTAGAAGKFRASFSGECQAVLQVTGERRPKGGSEMSVRAEITAAGRRGRVAMATMNALATMEADPGRVQVSASTLSAQAEMLAVPVRAVPAAVSMEARAQMAVRGVIDAQIQLTRLIFVPPKRRDVFVPPKRRVLRFSGDDRSLSMERFTKQPSEVVDYALDMEDWFDSIFEDFITDVQVTVTPTGDPDDLESGPDTLPVWVGVGDPAHQAQLWFGGGRDGIGYKVTAVVRTNVGRVEEVEFLVLVEDQ